MHVKLSDLNPLVRNRCKQLGHNRDSIQVHPAEEVSTEYQGNAGSRGVFCLINTRTGIEETEYGSWGGSNAFVERNVDQGKAVVLLGDLVALKGSTGHFNLLHLYVPPEVYETMKQPEAVPLTRAEQVVLYAHKSLKGGHYRIEHYQRNQIDHKSAIESLVGRGMLKQNKAGATSITPDGRNAAEQATKLSINGDLK
jgi:hypothetical protein